MSAYASEEQLKRLIGKRIKQLRERAGLTQEALGAEAKLARNSISRYECGHGALNLKVLLAIAKELRVPLVRLLEDPQLSLVVREPAEPSYWTGIADREASHLPYVQLWDGTWPLPKSTTTRPVRSRLLPHQECLVTLMPDDAMNPLIERGDAVIVDPAIRDPEHGTIVVLRIAEHTLVRLVIEEDGLIIYHSLQDHIPDITGSKRCRVIGQVVAMTGRSLKDPTINLADKLSAEI
jgi:transcriptional regulator with XRE-family HTH domain